MTIFQQYVDTIERYIETQLQDINFQEFSEMIQKRPDEIDGPLFEMLLSFSEFPTFKEMMLAHKNQTQGGNDFLMIGNSMSLQPDSAGLDLQIGNAQFK